MHTYTNIVEMTNTPGTKLHTAWKDVPAPQIAIEYWKVDIADRTKPGAF